LFLKFTMKNYLKLRDDMKAERLDSVGKLWKIILFFYRMRKRLIMFNNYCKRLTNKRLHIYYIYICRLTWRAFHIAGLITQTIR